MPRLGVPVHVYLIIIDIFIVCVIQVILAVTLKNIIAVTVIRIVVGQLMIVVLLLQQQFKKRAEVWVDAVSVMPTAIQSGENAPNSMIVSPLYVVVLCDS